MLSRHLLVVSLLVKGLLFSSVATKVTMEELRKHATLVVLVRQALAASSVGFAASLLLVEGVESGQEAGAAAAAAGGGSGCGLFWVGHGDYKYSGVF